MLIFFKKIFIFVIPVGLLLLFPALILFYGKEYFSYKDIVLTQERYPEALFGFAYNGASFYPYKKYLTEVRKPQVIALGTSRVMQFRKEFFTSSTSFINAGGAGKSLLDIESFINDLPSDGSVKVIILGLDEEVVTGPSASVDVKSESVLPVRFTEMAIVMARRMYLDYMAHKYTIKAILQASSLTHNIGLSAMLYGNGFRSDGSYLYGAAMNDTSRVSTVSTQILDRAKSIRGLSKVSDDKKIDTIYSNLQVVERILINAKEKNIKIVGFMPPYPTPIYDAKIGRDGMLAYSSKNLSELFSKYHYSFFDLSSIGTFGGKDTEFVDYNHGTDVMYLRLMIYIDEHSKSLSGLSDPVILKDLLKRSTGDFLDF